MQVKEEPAVGKPALEFLERRRRVLLIVLLVLASARIVSTYTVFSQTMDEPAHIACGMEWLDKGVYRWEAQHPPLARVAAALGPYLLDIRSQGTKNENDDSKYIEGNAILFYGHRLDRNLAAARLGILPFFWIGCLVVYFWGKRYFGAATAVVAVFFFSFLPPVLAHGGLATTDMALTAFMGAAFLTGLIWLQKPSAANGVLFGVATALAILSKFSTLVFLPAAAAAALAWYFAAERPGTAAVLRAVRPRLATFGLAVLTACLLIWAGYRFSFDKVPAPELWLGIREVIEHNAKGHAAYLLGQRSPDGFWDFFPVVLAVKTPIGFLVLMLAGAWLVVRKRSPLGRGWIPLAFSGAILAAGMASRINIGIRHILPVYIGSSLLAAAAVVHAIEMKGRPKWLAAVGVLVLWFAASSLLSHPDYLAYFNEFAGSRPENIVVDSDLDWGQDIKRLGARLKQVGAKEVTFASFTDINLERDLGFPHLISKMEATQPNPGWNAVSLTRLKDFRLGLGDRYPDVVLWPDRAPIQERVGKSILLWYFPE